MTIVSEVDGSVALIRFNRPDVLNAFNDEMGAAALEAVTEASENDAIRCIVLTGEGRAFSAGEDLGALADGYRAGEAPPLGDTLVNRYNPLVRAITDAPKPVVAAVNGVAAGAGASIALACDHRIMVDQAKLVLAFIQVGLVPDSGALWFLERAIGAARTWQLASTGRPVDASEAHELGLADEVVPSEGFESTWKTFAGRLAEGPTVAYALTKSLLYGAHDRSLSEQLEAEVDGQTRAGRSDDHLEGVQAFLAKRRPVFKGR